MALKTKPLFSFFKDRRELAREALIRLLLWKIRHARGTVVTISPRDVKTILRINNHSLETELGKLLASYAREGKVELIRASKPRRYLVRSELLEELFGLNYDSLQNKPAFTLTWLEIFYLTLKLYEGSWNGNGN